MRVVHERKILQRDFDFYHKARILAGNAEHRVRVGCVAAHNGKLLAGAFNTIRNDAKVVSYPQATYHAEHNTINLIPERLLSRCTLYVARIDVDGNWRPSHPCKYCIAEIKEAGIREVVYVTTADRLVKEYI